MSRKTLALIISGIVLFIIGFLLYAYWLSTQPVKGNNPINQSIREFFPFGNLPTNSVGGGVNVTPIQNTEATSTNSNAPLAEIKIPKLRHITLVPTSGDTVLDRKREVIENKVKKVINEQFIRYMDRATGNIFETKKDSLVVDRLTNTTIPKVHEAIFGVDGNSVIARFLGDDPDTILTYSIALKDQVSTSTATTTPGVSTASNTPKFKIVSGNYLQNNIKEISMSPLKTRLLYLTYQNEGGKFSVSNVDGSKLKTVLAYPLREWLIDWPSEGQAIISTKPTGIAEGFSYSVNTVTGSTARIAGGDLGFTISVSPNLVKALLGSGGESIGTSILDLKTGIETPFSLSTLPEKCVWGRKEPETLYCAVPTSVPISLYPDSWYQSRLSFNDSLWKIDTKTGKTDFLVSPIAEVGENLDATHLAISSDDSYLTFINKKDLTLWGLRLIEDIKPTATSTLSGGTGSSTLSASTSPFGEIKKK